MHLTPGSKSGYGWILVAFITLSLAFDFTLIASPVSGTLDKNSFPDIYRVLCTNQPHGCPCYADPGMKDRITQRLLHFYPVYNPEIRGGLASIEVNDSDSCYFPSASLEKMSYSPVLRSGSQMRNHAPIPLEKLVDTSGKKVSKVIEEGRRVSLGKFWPTFYHMAMEDFHPGPKIKALSPQGKVLGYASREFLRNVTWEGSGIAKDGTVYQYGGRRWRYKILKDVSWSYGAGYGYRIFPYRTLAVNYPGICKLLGNSIKGCTKKKVIGLMVKIPEIADKNIQMADGRPHDGYFCLTDTGSPYFIRQDRIDIFVGTHGGGNPYLPPERRKNLLNTGGIKALVPYDWRLWTSKKKRYWCDLDKLPLDPANPRKGECVLDYHTTVPQKALTLEALFDRNGNPIRCKKNP